MLTISAEFIVCLILISVMSVQVLCDKCPPISDGDSSPYCTCKYGPPYDEVTNTCPDPKCPPESIDFGYPDCFCFERNSDYSAYTNECFRVCPVNSSGYWPNCTCDDKLAQFDKKNFECRKCPEDSAKGDIYPNCNCDKVGPYNQYENKCVKCPQGSKGVFPNCTCIDERMNFNQFISKCQICPHGSSGKVPTCVCDNGSEYYVYGNYCIGCPYGSTGNFPNCKCRDGGYFDGKSCRNCGFYGNCTCEGNKVYDEKDGLCLECPPEQSTGTYPYCVCEEPFQYNKKTKRCVKCPKDSNGIFPNCECSNGLFETTLGVCIECPVDATGIFPDCKCQREDHIFSAYINECYIKCGNGSEGIHPKCKCSEPGTYYDPAVFTCKSNIGRKCPPTSVGVGPDCLCVQKHRTFFEKYWNCLQQDPASTAFLVPLVCPDLNDKWPQCSTEVDPRVLRSLIG